MALNVAVSTAMELFEDNDLVFPVSMGRENLKILVSPGSESSGVSSLDAEEAKKLTVEQLTSSSPIEPIESELVQTKEIHSADENDDSGVDEQDQAPALPTLLADNAETKNDENVAAPSSVETIETADATEIIPLVDTDGAEATVKTTTSIDDDKANDDLEDARRYKNLKVMYDGRDILDFCTNIGNKSWYIQYTYLPEKNISMCLANRSQYHRLGSGWDTKEYTLDTCRKCSFQYPVKFPDYQMAAGPKNNNALDALNSNGLNDVTVQSMFNINNNNNNNNHNNNICSSINANTNANNQKLLNMFNTNNINNNLNNNNGYQSMYPNQYNNVAAATAAANNNNTMSASKQANYGFQYNGNANANNNNINGFMNNFYQSVNSANNNNNNTKQLNAMYRQYLNNSNNANNSNNVAAAAANTNNNNNNNNNNSKMPYKMYSHFY